MSYKNVYRSGDKYSSNYKSYLPSAVILTDRAIEEDEVTGIVPDITNAGLAHAGQHPTVKMMCLKHSVSVKVHGGTASQKIHITTNDPEKTKKTLLLFAQEQGFVILPKTRKAQKKSVERKNSSCSRR